MPIANIQVTPSFHHSSYQSSKYTNSTYNSATNSSSDSSNSDHGEFAFSVGSYYHRNGILEKLGDTYATLALQYTNLKSEHTGIYFLWTMDHFWQTNNELLKPSFWDEDYANYMVSMGYQFRQNLAKFFEVYYQIGPAINFIEIDTDYTNGNPNNSLFTDITFSIVHKFGFNLDLSPERPDKFLIGLSIFSYFAPNPLGKFLDDSADIKVIEGSSSAWLIDFKWRW